MFEAFSSGVGLLFITDVKSDFTCEGTELWLCSLELVFVTTVYPQPREAIT